MVTPGKVVDRRLTPVWDSTPSPWHDFNASFLSYVLYKTYFLFNEINGLDRSSFHVKYDFSYRENISRCSKALFHDIKQLSEYEKGSRSECIVDGHPDASGIIDRLAAAP
jgi:hypothetical protein